MWASPVAGEQEKEYKAVGRGQEGKPNTSTRARAHYRPDFRQGRSRDTGNLGKLEEADTKARPGIPYLTGIPPARSPQSPAFLAAEILLIIQYMIYKSTQIYYQ